MEPQQIVLDQTEYKTIILGTGLLESLLSTALAYKGFPSVNLDKDISYSSAMKTCSLKEFKQVFTELLPSQSNKSFKIINYQDDMTEEESKNKSRGFNIDLQPRFLYSRSQTVDKMIEAGMDKYMDFRAINGIYFFSEDKQKFVLVPTNKGEIFASDEFGLIEKRNLFKLLHMCSALYTKLNQVQVDQNSTAEFDKDLLLDEDEVKKIMDMRKKHFKEFLTHYKVSDKLAKMLLYIIGNYQFSFQESETPEHFVSTEDFINRINKFLRSAGVHSTYPYLYTNYGTSDILQGFSRSSAVFGSLFIVNKDLVLDEIVINPPKENNINFKLKTPIAGPSEYLTSRFMVLNKDYVPLIKGLKEGQELEKKALLRMTFIVRSEDENLQLDTPGMYYIFPDNKTLNNTHPVFVFLTGEKTSSAPEGAYIFYVQTIVDSDTPQDVLKEYATKIRSLLDTALIKEAKVRNLVSVVYLQVRRKFAGEEELKEKPNIVVVDDDDFLLEFDDYYKKAEDYTRHLVPENPEMLFFENFEKKTKEDLEKKLEAEDEAEQETHLNELLEKLDKLKAGKGQEKEEKEGAGDQPEESQNQAQAQGQNTENNEQ